MNKQYLQYGLIAAAVMALLYFVLRRGGSSQSGQTTFNTIPVDVNYTADTAGRTAELAARGEAFLGLTGLADRIYTEESAIQQSQIVNETARAISRDESNLAYNLEALRADSRFREIQFQTGQVNALAESFRDTNIARQSNVLNALTSLWGGSTGYTYPQSTGGATGVLNAIAGIFRGGAGLLGF